MSCCTLFTRLLTIRQSWWNKGLCLAYFVLISCSVHWLMALEILYHESNFKATMLYLSLFWNIYGRLQATGVSLCTYFFVVNICVFFRLKTFLPDRHFYHSAFLGSKFLVTSLCPPSSELQCGLLWCFCVFFFPAECSGCNYWWNVRTFLMYWTCCYWWQINCTENICQNRYITIYAVIILLFLVWKRSAYTCYMKHIKTWVMSQGLERGCFL